MEAALLQKQDMTQSIPQVFNVLIKSAVMHYVIPTASTLVRRIVLDLRPQSLAEDPFLLAYLFCGTV